MEGARSSERTWGSHSQIFIDIPYIQWGAISSYLEFPKHLIEKRGIQVQRLFVETHGSCLFELDHESEFSVALTLVVAFPFHPKWSFFQILIRKKLNPSSALSKLSSCHTQMCCSLQKKPWFLPSVAPLAHAKRSTPAARWLGSS